MDIETEKVIELVFPNGISGKLTNLLFKLNLLFKNGIYYL